MRLSSFLTELMMDQEGLIQFLEEVSNDSAAFGNILRRTSGRSYRVGIDYPEHLAPLRLFGDTEGMVRFLLALVSGSMGFRRLVKALAKIKVRQVKFECSQEFYKRIMDEKLKRNLTVQQLAIRALERYFAVPESVHRGIEEEAEKTNTPLPELLRRVTQSLSSFAHPEKLGVRLAMDEEALQLRNDLEAIQHYLEQLPLEKIGLVRESLELDLKYYRSSQKKSER